MEQNEIHIEEMECEEQSERALDCALHSAATLARELSTGHQLALGNKRRPEVVDKDMALIREQLIVHYKDAEYAFWQQHTGCEDELGHTSVLDFFTWNGEKPRCRILIEVTGAVASLKLVSCKRCCVNS